MQMMELLTNQLKAGGLLATKGKQGKNAETGAFQKAISEFLNTGGAQVTGDASLLLSDSVTDDLPEMLREELEKVLQQLKDLFESDEKLFNQFMMKMEEEVIAGNVSNEEKNVLMQIATGNTVPKVEKKGLWKEVTGKLANLLESIREGASEPMLLQVSEAVKDLHSRISAEETGRLDVNSFTQRINSSVPVKGEAVNRERLTIILERFQEIIIPKGYQKTDKEFSATQVKEVRDLLTTFIRESKGKNIMTLLQQLPVKEEGKAVFGQLVKHVQLRQQVASAYNFQQITVKHIGKWLTQVSAGDKQSSTGVPLATGEGENKTTVGHQAPMTKVEQFIIKVDQNSQTPQQKQVLQQLQDMVQSSRMFTTKAGHQEMQIKLNPSNLGEMTVKFTQINGEMAVRILVTSQAAKEMLEGNMQQLRHMFSPQQVVVEKADPSMNQSFMTEEESASFQEEEEHSSEQSFDDDFEEEDSSEETVSFSDILNEKV